MDQTHQLFGPVGLVQAPGGQVNGQGLHTGGLRQCNCAGARCRPWARCGPIDGAVCEALRLVAREQEAGQGTLG